MEDVQLCSNLKIVIERMKHEAAEHQADFQRISNSLGAVGISLASFGSERGMNRYLDSVVTASSVLDVLTPDRVNLTLGISDLNEEVESSQEMLESSHKRIDKHRSELLNMMKEREWWQKVLLELEAKDSDNQSECNKAMKSTLFHSKKKTQYDTEIKHGRQALSSVGYEQSLDHESLVRLGSEVRDMEEQLKPLRLQLNCYKDLPPSLTQARVKLQEKRNSFNEIDKVFSERLVDVAANASPD